MKESSLGEHLSSSANVDAKTRACMRLKCDLSRALETSHDTAGKNLTNIFLFQGLLSVCWQKSLPGAFMVLGLICSCFKWMSGEGESRNGEERGLVELLGSMLPCYPC